MSDDLSGSRSDNNNYQQAESMIPEQAPHDTGFQSDASVEAQPIGKDRSKKKNCCGMMCFGCASVFFVLVVIIGVVLGVVVSENKVWTENFEQEKDEFISVSEETFSEDAYNKILEKTAEFSESAEDVHFIELTPEEVGMILFSVIKESIPDQMALEEVVIDPDNSFWELYVDLRYGGIELPWLFIEFEEDDEQSMDLRVSRARFGVIKIKRDGFFNVLGKINDGYLGGLSTVDDNVMTGRELVNIELEKDALFIKGELREE